MNKIYVDYLGYLLKHKWLVLLECFKVGLYWQGITHDNSKFKRDEFIPYAKFLYGGKKEEDKEAFTRAVQLHYNRNPHHWQYWEESWLYEGYKPMPSWYIKEMVCDWVGAGLSINGVDDSIEFYEKQKDKIGLTISTRKLVEEFLYTKKLDNMGVDISI